MATVRRDVLRIPMRLIEKNEWKGIDVSAANLFLSEVNFLIHPLRPLPRPIHSKGPMRGRGILFTC